MSNPSNILSKFRSYSYHHILIVTDGMNTAQQLSEQTDVIFFNRDTRSQTERYSPKFLGPNQTLGYVVLVDGMRDATFSISSAKWETVISPNRVVNGQNSANTIEVDGEIELVEAFGINFLDVLANASKNLQTDPSGLVFVLKTIFIGYTSDGNEEIISNIRPFQFTMTDITAVIDSGGTRYRIELVGINNGTAKLPQISRIADGINLQIGNESVGTALKKLETQINNKYQIFKQNLSNQLKTSNADLNVDEDFRTVKYVITPAPDYFKEQYTVGNNSNVTEQDVPGVTQIACGQNSTIEQMISKIMDSSVQVAKDASAKNNENKKYIYKIVSTLLPDLIENNLVVEYTVHRYQVIEQVVGQELNPSPGEFIEFDYIYTGRNIDILDFDIKMDMGLSFFYTLATSKNIPNTQEEVLRKISNDQLIKGPGGSSNGSADPTAVSSGNKQKRIKTPLFLGYTIKDPIIRNKAEPHDSATFDTLLSRHAAFENIEAKMTIAGNPQLLDELLPLPEEVSAGKTEEPKQGTTGTQSFLTTPSLIKVNIKFPNDNNSLDDFKDFWYRGFYNLYSVINSFDNGLFTQELSMYSLPQTEGIDEKLSTKVERDTSETSTSSITSPGDASDTLVRDLT